MSEKSDSVDFGTSSEEDPMEAQARAIEEENEKAQALAEFREILRSLDVEELSKAELDYARFIATNAKPEVEVEKVVVATPTPKDLAVEPKSSSSTTFQIIVVLLLVYLCFVYTLNYVHWIGFSKRFPAQSKLRMASALAIACTVIAFIIPVGIIQQLVYVRNHLLIVAVSAAFTYQCSLMLTTLTWNIFKPPRPVTLLLPVLFVELARWMFIRVYVKTERSFSVTGPNAIMFPTSDFTSSLVSGSAFGAMHSLVYLGALFSYNDEQNTLFSENCYDISVLVIAAWSGVSMSILHICLMLLAFHWFRQNSLKIVIVHAFHAGAALTGMIANRCILRQIVLMSVGALTIALTYTIVNSVGYRSKIRI